MKYFSLFSGIGGFELGIQQAYVEIINRNKNGKSKENPKKHVAKRKRLESEKRENAQNTNSQPGELLDWINDERAPDCVGFSEIDKYATQIYQKHFPEHKNYGDITKINAQELPDFELLVGGFPCQPFSIAGRRGGFLDTRGTLFFEIARIVREKQPRLLLLENVKGLLSHGNGDTFYTIITALDELGYDTQWQVLNSKNFGVPQNRERVFIVGHIRGMPRPKVFPIFGSDEEFAGETIEHRRENYINQMNNPKHSNNRVYSESGLSPSLNTMQGGNRQPKIIQPILTPERKTKRQDGRRMKDNGEPSFTITNQDRHGIFDGAEIRRLTPLECERLQGFPDGWTSEVSETQRYKCLGNAVTVNVIKAIAGKLLKT